MAVQYRRLGKAFTSPLLMNIMFILVKFLKTTDFMQISYKT
jgi:hypothetical protein